VRKTRFGTIFDHFVIVEHRKTRTGVNSVAIADRTNIYYIILYIRKYRIRRMTFHEHTIFRVRIVCIYRHEFAVSTLYLVHILLYPNTSRFREIVGVHRVQLNRKPSTTKSDTTSIIIFLKRAPTYIAQ
jgi:hypothetical protein